MQFLKQLHILWDLLRPYIPKIVFKKKKTCYDVLSISSKFVTYMWQKEKSYRNEEPCRLFDMQFLLNTLFEIMIKICLHVASFISVILELVYRCIIVYMMFSLNKSTVWRNIYILIKLRKIFFFLRLNFKSPMSLDGDYNNE